MNDEECLALFDRMQRLDAIRYKQRRIAFAQKFGLVDDICPRCGAPLSLENPSPQSPCYCSCCAFAPDVNTDLIRRGGLVSPKADVAVSLHTHAHNRPFGHAEK